MLSCPTAGFPVLYHRSALGLLGLLVLQTQAVRAVSVLEFISPLANDQTDACVSSPVSNDSSGVAFTAVPPRDQAGIPEIAGLCLRCHFSWLSLLCLSSTPLPVFPGSTSLISWTQMFISGSASRESYLRLLHKSSPNTSSCFPVYSN